MADKTYVDITSFLTDLNLLISPIQTYLSSTEKCPVFSLSTTELNKYIVLLLNNDTVTINLFSSVVDRENIGHFSVELIYVF